MRKYAGAELHNFDDIHIHAERFENSSDEGLDEE
jgi:hypothetical protein